MYVITKETKAIIAKELGLYRAKVLHGKKKRYSIHTLKQIIANNCIFNHSSLECQELAAQQILRTKSKLPIPIIPKKGVFMFPTASIRNKNCALLSYYHIDYYEQRNDQTYIAFQDGTGIYINTSEKALDRQYKKTSQLIAAFHRTAIFG